MNHATRVAALAAAVAIWGVPAVAAVEAEAKSEAAPAAGIEGRKPGEVVALGGRKVTVREVDITAVVRNTFSERFTYDRYDNVKLRTLREREKLEEVIAGGKDEFDKQVRLMDWVHNRFKLFGTPSSRPTGALEIFDAVDKGGRFFCAHYATALVSCAASLGWIDRSMGLHVSNTPPGRGATEHSATEIWSNQYRKWVFFDPTYAGYVEKDGVPLSGWEVRQEWFYGDASKLDFVVGKQRKKYKKKDMPIFRSRHAGYGDLAWKPRSVDKLAFMFMIPNTNAMDAGPDYAKGFILKDEKVCRGVKYHTRDNPKDPATEPYFPLNQADLKLTPAEGRGAALKVTVDTMTPNFAGYRYRIDATGQWKEGEPGRWVLHQGRNTLEVVSVNKFGVEGVPSKVVLDAE